MALNEYIIKEKATIMFVCFLTLIGYAAGTMFFNFWYGLAFALLAILLSVFVAPVILAHPFTDMIKGKGLMVFDLTSTGIIRPFLVTMRPPFVKGNFDGKQINDVFDREAIYQLTPPVKVKEMATQDENGNLTLTLNTEDYAKAKFVMNTIPVMIWNSQLKTLLTKEYLSKNEKKAFTTHTVLYLQKTIEELSSSVRDFARYVVETLNPQETKSNPMKWILILGGIILFGAAAYYLGPKVMEIIKGAGGAARQGVSSIQSSGATAAQTGAIITPTP